MLFLLAILSIMLQLASCGHPFTVHDMVALARLGEFAIAPNSTVAAYTTTSYPEDSDAGTTTLFFGTMIPDSPSALTAVDSFTTASSPGNLQWISDSSGLMLTASDSQGIQQVFFLDTTSYKMTQVTSNPIDILFFKYSEVSEKLIFVSEVFYGMDLDQTAAHNAERAARTYVGEKYNPTTAGYITHWDVYMTPDRWQNLWSVTVSFDGRNYVADNDFVNLMDIRADCPLKPFGDASSFDISPDGTTLAFVTQRGHDVQWTTDDSIYTVPVTGSSAPTCITCWNPARDASPMYSPDGKWIYMLSMTEAKSESDRIRLRRQRVRDGLVQDITGDWDRDVDQMLFDPIDPTHAYIVASEHARSKIWELDLVVGATPTVVAEGGSVSSMVISPTGDTLYYSRAQFTRPADIYGLAIGASEPAQMTTMNDQLLSEISPALADPIEFWLPGGGDASGDMVQSWFFPPLGYVEGVTKDVPVICYVHGGPESPWDDGWSYRWNYEVMAAQGYALVATNFHGSSSFGLEFSKSIRENWFNADNGPYYDVHAALVHVLDTYSWLDASNVGAMGASYGGTFINWLNGHPFPDVDVKTLICHDGIFDLLQFGLDTDELYFPTLEMGCSPLDSWDQVQATWERWNPARSAGSFSTPMMVIHGGQDYRILKSHGVAAYQTCKWMGLDTEYVFFETQSHWVWQPQESIFWHDNVFEWLAKYLKDE
eukprot:gnl/Dysnectes_brevis/1982_a2281_2822.p1 GENE.gnl/Dysnectes_brevis/1982_a2281_2822~~gnl/Dysnectes_brevis/1982_a2281_2822.p1  ORF type:complete len:711 (+),score=277.00 gnl/Dysnectes_brevis/1982_a2281_2822:78-2210(+)